MKVLETGSPGSKDCDGNERKHSVVLIHGIRTQANWAKRTIDVLQEDSEVRGVLIN